MLTEPIESLRPFTLAQQAFEEAYACLKEAEYYIKTYNSVVADLYRMGYVQVPEATGIACANYNDGYNGGGYDGITSKIIKNLSTHQPLTLYLRETKATYEGSLADLRRRLGDSEGWVCTYCSGLGNYELGPDGRTWHVDHIYPKHMGGDDGMDNLVLACATCNLRKSARFLRDFLADRRAERCR